MAQDNDALLARVGDTQSRGNLVSGISDSTSSTTKNSPMKASPFHLPTKFKRFHALTSSRQIYRAVRRGKV